MTTNTNSAQERTASIDLAQLDTEKLLEGVSRLADWIKPVGKGSAEDLRAIIDLARRASATPSSKDAGGGSSNELLDMLGRIHPFAIDQKDRAKAYERLERAFVIQQPWPVPDQACIVWRADLMDMRYDLVHKQSCFDSAKAKRESADAPVHAAAGPSAAQADFDTMERDDWHKLAELRTLLELKTELPFTVLQFAIVRIKRLMHEVSAGAAAKTEQARDE